MCSDTCSGSAVVPSVWKNRVGSIFAGCDDDVIRLAGLVMLSEVQQATALVEAMNSQNRSGHGGSLKDPGS